MRSGTLSFTSMQAIRPCLSIRQIGIGSPQRLKKSLSLTRLMPKRSKISSSWHGLRSLLSCQSRQSTMALLRVKSPASHTRQRPSISFSTASCTVVSASPTSSLTSTLKKLKRQSSSRTSPTSSKISMLKRMRQSSSSDKSFSILLMKIHLL